MRVDTFDYDLSPDTVAQRPARVRDAARLLVLRGQGSPHHSFVRELPQLLPAGALVVVNDTRVVPARLVGRKVPTGGRAEVLLLRRESVDEGGGPQVWEAMGRASKGLGEGTRIDCGEVLVRVLGRSQGGAASPVLRVEIESTGAPLGEALGRAGHMPLPPYIRREDDRLDRDRYQTVFARADGAVAAPTAGLHFTEELLGALRDAGFPVVPITLHVGLGTFQPVTARDLDDHVMHAEAFEISQGAADAVADAREREAPIVAVGTTVVRALESAADVQRPGLVRAMRAETRLLIQPGYSFRVVDVLLTNFHVPRSTLLALVCGFGGTERVLDAYALAQSSGYRFFSYGDAMLLDRAA